MVKTHRIASATTTWKFFDAHVGAAPRVDLHDDDLGCGPDCSCAIWAGVPAATCTGTTSAAMIAHAATPVAGEKATFALQTWPQPLPHPRARAPGEHVLVLHVWTSRGRLTEFAACSPRRDFLLNDWVRQPLEA